MTTFFAFPCSAIPSNTIELTASEEVRTGKPPHHNCVATTMWSSARIFLRKFGGDMVIEIMQTHPVVIIGRILQQNAFFMPPEEFLREVRKWRTRQTASTYQAV